MKFINIIECPTHKVYEIMGVKFKIRRSRLEQEVHLLRRLLEQSIDITKIPKAKGNLRKVQLIKIKLLELTDIILKKHNITYWLEYGTLIGAIRHKGFIPRDDDVDVALLKDDYIKLPEIFEEKFSGTPVKFIYGTSSQIIKVVYKDFQLDFFPMEYINEHLETEFQKDEFLEKWLEIRSLYLKSYPMKLFKTGKRNHFELMGVCDKLKNKIFNVNYIQNKESNQVIRAVETMTATTNAAVFGIDSIFPLQNIEFEGLLLPAPKDPLQHLAEAKEYGHYGAVMNFPRISDSGFEHTQNNYEDYDYDTDLKELEELIERFKVNK